MYILWYTILYYDTLKISLKKSNICIFFHSIWKNLHLTENLYTGTACGACEKYEVRVEIITMIKNVPPGDPATEVLGEWGWGISWDGLGGGGGEQGGQRHHHHHHSQKFTKTISKGDDHIEQWDKRGNNQRWQVDGNDDAELLTLTMICSRQ